MQEEVKHTKIAEAFIILSAHLQGEKGKAFYQKYESGFTLLMPNLRKLLEEISKNEKPVRKPRAKKATPDDWPDVIY